MCKIMINTDINAPGCPCEIVPVCECGNQVRGMKSILVQSDWAYPSIASSFGWDIKYVQKLVIDEDGNELEGYEDCEHDGTDGTVRCELCKLTASDFIAAAYDFLTENDGLIVDDHGYFE